MQTDQIEFFHRWFREYVESFYSGDPEIDEALRLKDRHSRHVAAHMGGIARSLRRSEQDVRLAETVGLFHDLGRFPQWRQYGTFNDNKSIDHGELSVETLRATEVLASLPSKDRRVVEIAARYHNKKRIPSRLSERHRLFTEMVRDADKIDIWRQEISHFEKKGLERPILTRLLRGEFPATATFSSKMFDSVMSSEQPNLDEVRTHDDYVLFRLSWIYDINFKTSAKTILERNYVDRLLSRMPPTQDVRMLKAHLTEHLRQLGQCSC